MREPGLAARLTPEQAAAPVVLAEGEDARTLGDVLAELDADAEFADQLDLCRAGGAA